MTDATGGIDAGMGSSIIWFRNDLRLADQAAVAVAAARGRVLPVYVLDDETPGPWALGGARRWWLHHSLLRLDADLKAKGARLVLARGRPEAVLPMLAAAVGAETVHALAHVEPYARDQEVAVAERLDLRLYPGVTLSPPGAVLTGSGKRYQVFTPFWRALSERMPPAPSSPAPDRLEMADGAPAGDRLEDWGLLPTKPDWAGGMRDSWTPGEAGAAARLSDFLDIAAGYDKGRNLPGHALTSRLSPHLAHGEVSPKQIWHALSDAIGARAMPYLREIDWRDFAYDLIDQYPAFPDVAHRPAFEAMPWTDVATDEGAVHLRAWQRGLTGYPIVDAGMRELWHTGWMHNRVRMIVASFLTKHLMIDWRAGERWFWDALVDADLPNNAAGWQWVAGSGVDAAPYFRIFAPVAQSQKFDPQGLYLRRWLPELARLPDSLIHAPWEAPPMLLTQAGVRLGRDYPLPLVDHKLARQRALDAYATIRGRHDD